MTSNEVNVQLSHTPQKRAGGISVLAGRLHVHLLYIKRESVLTSSQICKFNAQSVLTSDSEVACSIRPPIGVENSPVDTQGEIEMCMREG